MNSLLRRYAEKAKELEIEKGRYIKKIEAQQREILNSISFDEACSYLEGLSPDNFYSHENFEWDKRFEAYIEPFTFSLRRLCAPSEGLHYSLEVRIAQEGFNDLSRAIAPLLHHSRVDQRLVNLYCSLGEMVEMRSR